MTKDAAFILPIRVYYQDTDAGGVVYHSTYLNFMERARYEWMRELGLDIHSLIQVHKVVFMIRSLNIEYFKPALLDDLLHVTVQAIELGKTRAEHAERVLCEFCDRTWQNSHSTLSACSARSCHFGQCDYPCGVCRC